MQTNHKKQKAAARNEYNTRNENTKTNISNDSENYISLDHLPVNCWGFLLLGLQLMTNLKAPIFYITLSFT